MRELPTGNAPSFEIAKDGAALAALGDVEVLHPVVEHKRFSPGWTLGYNGAELVAYGTKNAEHFANVTFRGAEGAFNRNFEIPRLAGMKTVRHWGTWLDIEPEQGKFRSDLTDMSINGYRQQGIEPIFCLVGNLFYCDDEGPMAKYPLFLYKYRVGLDGPKPDPGIMPPMDIYGAYLDFCLKTWGKDVHIWEMFNEPGHATFDAKRYLEYLRHSYQTIKAHDPKDLLLGNGNTCDTGFSPTDWCVRLNNADPDYPNYLDGVAFHPYHNATDYQRGSTGSTPKTPKISGAS